MDQNSDFSVDFKNADATIDYFNSQRNKRADEPVYVATILVRFSAFKSIGVRDALIEFVKQLFDGTEPFYEGTARETRMYFYDRTADDDKKVNALLDKCVTLNTYFKHYFFPNGDVTGFCIYYGIHCDTDKLTSLSFSNHYDAGDDYLDINEMVKLNSKASELLRKAKRIGKDASGQNVYEYDVEDNALARALDKKLKQ